MSSASTASWRFLVIELIQYEETDELEGIRPDSRPEDGQGLNIG